MISKTLIFRLFLAKNPHKKLFQIIRYDVSLDQMATMIANHMRTHHYEDNSHNNKQSVESLDYVLTECKRQKVDHIS